MSEHDFRQRLADAIGHSDALRHCHNSFCCGGSIPVHSAFVDSSSPEDSSINPSNMLGSNGGVPDTSRSGSDKEYEDGLIDTPIHDEPMASNSSMDTSQASLEDQQVQSQQPIFVYIGNMPPPISTFRFQFPATDESFVLFKRAFGIVQEASMSVDSRQISTTFHPHDYGILDAVAQALLPESVVSKKPLGARGVSARLRGMYVHGGLSIPVCEGLLASSNVGSFGILLVCLPRQHLGGPVIISQTPGKSATFRWSLKSAKHVQWAAFHKGCAYKIKPVEEGHQVILMYDLLVTRRVGVQAPTLDPQLFPMYPELHAILKDDKFMPQGYSHHVCYTQL